MTWNEEEICYSLSSGTCYTIANMFAVPTRIQPLALRANKLSSRLIPAARTPRGFVQMPFSRYLTRRAIAHSHRQQHEYLLQKRA